MQSHPVHDLKHDCYNSGLEGTSIPVTYSCARPNARRWADGACINQEDLQERGQNVTLMG